MGRTCFAWGPYDTRGRTAKQGPKSMALSAERRYGYRSPTQNKSAPSSRPGTSDFVERRAANVSGGRLRANVVGGRLEADVVGFSPVVGGGLGLGVGTWWGGGRQCAGAWWSRGG
ncbi:hypothetical protein Aglo03_40700 [Actinokineospora globicatena]|uniref:Uncharacterized protein n=1 Tax=Actinokineospora globicatena TaxID=103729 RepID=A0A9W6QRD4_9PSEU|nr:hypothetical protein Aglo03_40700 [Actinokineospora globicatena]